MTLDACHARALRSRANSARTFARMTPNPAVVRIDANAAAEEALELDPARLAPDSPMPEQFVRNAYADPTSQFFGGLWRSGVGAWRVHYTEHELCVLRSGRVRLRDDDGREWTFGPGECFVIPAGFRGLWEVLEPAEKFYAIYEPRTG